MSAIPKSWKPSRRDASSSLYGLIGDFIPQEIAIVGLIKVFVAIIHHGVSISSADVLKIDIRKLLAVADNEAGIPLPRRPGGNGGAAPVLGVSATAVMAASERPCVALPLVATTVVSVFLNFFAAHSDRNCVEVTANSKLAVGAGDQDDAIALAFAGNMSATNLDVSEIAVARHGCQTHVRSHIQVHLPV